jgi:predicted O-methyltransferase YrrM
MDWVEWSSGLGDHAHALYGLTRALKPRTIVEIGSARGRSTCTFALACADNGAGRVYAIDPHVQNEWTDVGTGGHTLTFLRDRLATYELEPYCTVLRTTSQEAAVNWSGGPIDFLFIDGNHEYLGVRSDFELFQPHLNAGSLVAFHDSSWEHEGPWERFRKETWFRDDMGVPRYLEELQSQGYESITLPETPGLTLLYPSKSKFSFRSL